MSQSLNERWWALEKALMEACGVEVPETVVGVRYEHRWGEPPTLTVEHLTIAPGTFEPTEVLVEFRAHVPPTRCNAYPSLLPHAPQCRLAGGHDGHHEWTLEPPEDTP